MAKITTNLFGELAIIPQPAETPVRETLEFLTDVMTSYNGKEKRLQLRSKPRQFFNYKIPVKAWNDPAIFNTAYGAIRKRWAVPIWTQGQFVGAVAQASNEILCNTEYFDLRPNSLAMLFEPCNRWQVVEIAEVLPDKIVLFQNPTTSFASAYLVPVRLGWVESNISKPTTGHNGTFEVTYEIEDNPFISTTPPAQYEGDDIYYEPGLLNGGKLSRSIEQRLETSDFSLGAVSRRTPWLNARYGTPYRVMTEGAQQAHEFRKFLFRRAGKFRQFWQPTFDVNLRIKNNALIASTLVVESDSYLAYAMNRTRVAFQTTAGAWHVRTISNPIQINADSLQLTLSSALNIHPNNIARTSFLGLNRFDADRIEINWGNNQTADAEVRILELRP